MFFPKQFYGQILIRQILNNFPIEPELYIDNTHMNIDFTPNTFECYNGSVL